MKTAKQYDAGPETINTARYHPIKDMLCIGDTESGLQDAQPFDLEMYDGTILRNCVVDLVELPVFLTRPRRARTRVIIEFDCPEKEGV